MPSLNISSVAQKSGSHAISKADTAAVEARQVLRDMRAQLVGQDGTISSGYLSINTRKDGTVNLETRGRHEWGSFHSDKKDASNIVKSLIRDGYGKHLGNGSETALLAELNTYLQTTDQRLGTHSFVKLIDRLEKNIAAAEAGPQTAAKVKADVRFKANFNLRLKTDGCAPQAKSQFKEIVDSVRPDTASLFKHILSPGVSKAGNVAARTQVVGDADGSMCRTVLSAINSGHMELKEPELKLLAEVMDAEAEASRAYDRMKDDPLVAFQKNPDIAAKLDQIVANATFKPGHHKLVYIGDIVHDRFSNNKVAMDQLIRGLHAQGAVFITGNHDVYDEVNKDNIYQLNGDQWDQFLEQYIADGKIELAKDNIQLSAEQEKGILAQFNDIKLQNGFHGAKQLDKTASDQLLKDCFTNAHFDSQTNALYTHNGFEHSGVDNVYLTAFGFLLADNAEELAEKMNACDFNATGMGLEQIAKDNPEFSNKFAPQDNHGIGEDGFISKTGFRPDDSRMQTDQLGPAGKSRAGKQVTIIHGHNAKHGTDGNVENLNARSRDGVTPITKVY